MAGRRDRERELARRRYERRQQRLAEARVRRRRRASIVAAGLAVLLVLAGAGYGISQLVGGGKPNKLVAGSTPTPTVSPTLPPGTCAYPKSGTAAKHNITPPSTTNVDTTHSYLTTMRTNRGTITWRSSAAKVPCTIHSFASLAAQKYFDHTPCHRLTTSSIYVLQCGDPTGTGSGGPGYSFGDENLVGAQYPAGAVAMANSGPNTNGSQFFLVYKDTQLPPNYTPFGVIVSGLDVVKRIAAKGSNPPSDGKPKLTVEIETFRVKRLG